MNEPFEPDLPELSETLPSDFPTAQIHPPEKTIPYWLKRFFSCNPFYIFSAALLLYGLYRASIDPHVLSKETAHLIFNFGSLQCYELLLVATAIFLARRRIWYDSMLLVGLENILILVPFILVSQAALIDKHLVWAMCVVGGALAILRFGNLKRFVTGINLPWRLTLIGLLILVVNVALPILYRILHESKFGTKPDWGAAYYTNKYVWLLVLPLFCGFGNFVPFSRRTEGLLPTRGWLPISCFALWLAGTGVHLYCLGYVYDFSLRPDMVAPVIWMLAWTLYRRIPQFTPLMTLHVARASLCLPIAAALLAAFHYDHMVFLALTTLNATIYQRIYARHGGPRLALHLLLISLAAIIAGLPQEWGSSFVTHFSRAELIGAGVAGYLLVCAALSSNPNLGVVGALVAAVAVGAFSGSLHWATQFGIVFLLLHSLRWSDGEVAGARGVRVFLCIVWVTHAFLWIHSGASAWMTCAIVTPVLAASLASRLLNGAWQARIVPLAALFVALSGPANASLAQLHSAPAGVLAVIGSFLLFALGTLAALTRHRWQREDQPE